MNETHEIDATSIEGELRELWQGLAQTEDKDGQAVMRACVLNLIVFCANGWDPQERSQALGEITSEHPSRVILITPVSGNEEMLEVTVTARCHSTAGGGNNVCCEVIHFSTSERSLDRVSSLIWPLLVSDLPTAVWWRSQPSAESSFLLSLIEMADRVIVDTEQLDPESSAFRQLRKLIETKMEQTAFSDLAWSRLTPWRRAIAGFSDVPSWKNHLADIERLEISYRRSNEMPLLSIRALYLLAWLGSRLNWKVEKPVGEEQPARIVLQKNDEGGRVEALLKARVSAPTEAGITGVRLVTGDNLTVSFEVWRRNEQRYLQSRVLFGERETGSRISHKSHQKESELVCRELEILGHDYVFEKAFCFAADSLP